MQVIDCEPLVWFLLQHENIYYVDVNCSLSFLGFFVLIKLDAAEWKQYQTLGNTFISQLSESITDQNDFYHPRMIDDESLLAMAHQCIIAWKVSRLSQLALSSIQ